MDKMKKIICEYVDVSENDIDENMSLQGDIGLDSFGLVSLVLDIESTFNVSIPESKLKEFQTLGDMYSFIVSNS